ncbi:MAG TPA: class I SAM-dependent methyltransferase [Burkholderiales bacterium]|nr:class I SAM-dependent methyltransferase [Burkholderiales bacterium]
MPFYRDHILPRLIDCSCSLPLVTRQREKIVPLATGRVLDVGAGSGLNLPLYDAARVTEVVGIEPDPTLRGLAQQRAQGRPFPIRLLPLRAEEDGLERQSFDTIVVTYALCSIQQIEAALANLRRLLKPNGRVLFCEHGAAPDANVRKWQDRLAPLWLSLAGGCHLNRDSVALLRSSGFAIDAFEMFYLRHTPRILGYHTIGTAHVS